MLLRELACLILAGTLCAYAYRRLLRYLRFLQQEEYKGERYLDWLKERSAYDRQASLVIAATLLAYLATRLVAWAWLPSLIIVCGAAALWMRAMLEPDPRVTGKLRLKMTERAQRTFQMCAVIFVIFAVVALGLTTRLFSCELGVMLAGLALAQSLPFIPFVASKALEPLEKHVQERLKNEAREKFLAIAPFTIGVTGSFGKTSTKSLLGQVLNTALGPTFWPQRGVNTLMGITREIRERLSPQHRYAVVEMGAYHRGSIKSLADFTPPHAAIVTAVGTMHLERFGSPEDVYRAKSELPQAVPADGILVLNGDNAGARRMADEFRKKTTLIYGLDPQAGPLDCSASDIRFTAKGSEFTINWQGAQFKARSPLLGRPAISNMLGAFTMAVALGAQPKLVAAAFANVEPVDNRLVLRPGTPTSYLQDAYNSNPVGFRAAMEILNQIPARRRILMTPGMIELGNTQDQENRSIGEFCATRCDFALIVGETNRAALVEGLKAGGMPEDRIIQLPTREAGFAKIRDMQEAGDLVLIENDLPDRLEFVERF
ncbi:MAG: UDP-N-acetylmuramoyl-tripeptide--D-alanyl-D-alanine ligase [Oligoflexia bacterium]|nr:UDP-N-acetylmuramoyl-tripeptide--D-alanyl-D-alanine ligase [Oligoflexia bacterium]